MNRRKECLPSKLIGSLPQYLNYLILSGYEVHQGHLQTWNTEFCFSMTLLPQLPEFTVTQPWGDSLAQCPSPCLQWQPGCPRFSWLKKNQVSHQFQRIQVRAERSLLPPSWTVPSPQSQNRNLRGSGTRMMENAEEPARSCSFSGLIVQKWRTHDQVDGRTGLAWNWIQSLVPTVYKALSLAQSRDKR